MLLKTALNVLVIFIQGVNMKKLLQSKNVKYLDSGKRIKVKNNEFTVEAYQYGTNYRYRIVKFNLK